MAILTPVELDDARRIGARFGLDVASIRLVPEGSVNTNAELVARDGRRWFLRIYEEQPPETARGEAAILAALAAAGVPTPMPLPLTDEVGDQGRAAIASHAGKAVAVFPFVEGEVVCQRGVTPARAAAVGAALAEVHLAGRAILAGPLGASVRATRFGPDALLARVRAVAANDPPPHVAEVLPHLARRCEEELEGAAPRGDEGFVHGDLFRDNVLFRGEAVAALLDFESASRGPLAFDLAVTLLAWCYGDDLDLALARALATGYARRAPVSPGVREALFDAARRACTRFATTRITDFELRPRGAGVHKDFRRWLARDAALVALGREGLDRALFG
jgi:homoserine kinase type II